MGPCRRRWRSREHSSGAIRTRWLQRISALKPWKVSLSMESAPPARSLPARSETISPSPSSTRFGPRPTSKPSSRASAATRAWANRPSTHQYRARRARCLALHRPFGFQNHGRSAEDRLSLEPVGRTRRWDLLTFDEDGRSRNEIAGDNLCGC